MSSGDRLRILFLAPRIPWPLDTGGKIRTYHLLRALARRHRVRLLTFGGEEVRRGGVDAMREAGAQPELFSPGGALRAALVTAQGIAGPLPRNVRKYVHLAVARRVAALVSGGEVDLLHCDHLHLAPYGPVARRPFVIDEHNVETVIWDRFARDRAEPLYRRAVFAQQAFWLRQTERWLTRRAALVLLCSAADGQALGEVAGSNHAPTKVVPNGVDVAAFSAPGEALHGGHVFFTGSMDWAPNDNAVTAFLDGMWPEVRRREPDLAFVVVGRNPSPALRARHGSDGVTVTGTVPDVRPHMRGALALLVPMRVGGGTRLKILEAFAARVPVVSTAVGIEGIDATPGEHYLRAETAAEFADAIQALKRDPALGRRLADDAEKLAKSRYSWESIGADLAEAYAQRFG